MANYDVQKNYRPSNKIAFDINNFDKFFIDHGAYTVWEQAYLCPCRTKSTNAPSQNCPRCNGLGFSFTKPKATLALIQSQDKNVMNKQDLGLTLAGSGTATVPKEDMVSYRDRLTMVDNLVPQSLLIYVTPSAVRDKIHVRYDVQEVTYARDDEGEIPIGEIKFDGEFFVPTPSMVGKYISINVLVTLRYYVVDVLREARFQYKGDPRSQQFQRALTNMPRKLLIRREDMFVPDIISGEGDVMVDPTTDVKRGIQDGFEGFF